MVRKSPSVSHQNTSLPLLDGKETVLDGPETYRTFNLLHE